jgi:hypothetical protein
MSNAATNCWTAYRSDRLSYYNEKVGASRKGRAHFLLVGLF